MPSTDTSVPFTSEDLPNGMVMVDSVPMSGFIALAFFSAALRCLRTLAMHFLERRQAGDTFLGLAFLAPGLTTPAAIRVSNRNGATRISWPPARRRFETTSFPALSQIGRASCRE